MSINEKRVLVDQLAVKIGYHTDIELNNNDMNFVWNLIDFGYSEDNVMQGKCSLQAMIEFDSEKWEHKLDEDINTLKNILKKDLISKLN